MPKRKKNRNGSAKANQIEPFEEEEQYEREDVQKKTFAKWVNSQLVKINHPPITDLFYDLRDGTALLALLEVLTSKKYKGEKGRMRVHQLNNVDKALKILEEQNVKLVNIANDHIVDGSAKMTLGLVWSIILHWQMKGVLKDVMSELHQTNLEKTLLAWCRQSTNGYQGVDIVNFTTSWRDGLAFCALIHKHRPDLFEWPVMAKKHPYSRLENAFRIAYEHFSIERLLDPEDVNTENPDKKSIMMYVMCLFQVLPRCNINMEESTSIPQDTASQEKEIMIASGLEVYQSSLEEVLTWLLGAEDKLATMPPIAKSTKEVKEQFHHLEELMLDLTSKQSGIGEVLGEGSRILRENELDSEETEEIRIQMKLLNTRWEELRVKAMDRQTKLHESLMKLQQDELEILKQWLTKTEDRIANMSQLGPTYPVLEQQFKSHQTLQQDLEAEQETINSLSNMVVVVDESNSDAAFSSLEDELNALGERWAHICKWAEQRWSVLQNLQFHWGDLDREILIFTDWLKEKETLLREMEMNPTIDPEEILQQAASLQVLQSEMDVKFVKLTVLHDKANLVLSYLPKESLANEKIPCSLEALQDRWDILVSIVEAHGQRFAASGIDVSKMVVLGADGSDVIKTTVTNKEGIVVTKTTSSKKESSDKKKEDSSAAKRQKISGKIQDDFNEAVKNLSQWMEALEEKTQHSVIESSSTEDLKTLFEELESEINNHENEYKNILSLAQSVNSETASIGESTVDNEVKLSSIKNKWATLGKSLHYIKQRIIFLENVNGLREPLESIKGTYTGIEDVINNIQSISCEENSGEAAKQLEECKENNKLLSNLSEELKEMESKVKILSSLFANEREELIRIIQGSIFDVQNITMRIQNQEIILNDYVSKTPSPILESRTFLTPVISTMEIEEMSSTTVKSVTSSLVMDFEPVDCGLSAQEQQNKIDEVYKYLNNVDDRLMYTSALSSTSAMEANLILFKGFLNEIEFQKNNLKMISANRNKNVKSHFNTTVIQLEKRVDDLTKGMEKLDNFNEEFSGLQSWLGEVETFLEAEDAAIGDVETLQAQLEQSNALQDDIVTLETNLSNIMSSGSYLEVNGDEELKTKTKNHLDEIQERWHQAIADAKKQNASLKEALEKSQKVWSDSENLNSFLSNLEENNPSFLVETTSEFNKICDAFENLQKEVDNMTPEYEFFEKNGEEMIQCVKRLSCEEFNEMFLDLQNRWRNTTSDIKRQYELVTSGRVKYERFKDLSAKEGAWLDELDSKIEKSTNKTTDAEEISEALDDLDNFLQEHPRERLDEIQRIADELTNDRMVSVAVQNISHNLTTRFNDLTSKGEEQQHRLEGGVQKSQDLERQYVKCLEQLSSYQVVFFHCPAEAQLLQIENEMKRHREVLVQLEETITLYESQGKVQASLRLRDQFTHLNKQLEDNEEKLRICQQSSDFEDKFINLSEQLSSIDQESREIDIDSVKVSHLEKQLEKYMMLYKRLSDVKSDVETVIATGRKRVKEGLSADPETSTLQLDQLKSLYNTLGGTVTEQRGRLEMSVKCSKKITKDSSQIDEWLDDTEKELDFRETRVNVDDVHGDIVFSQNAFDDLNRKKPMVSSLNDSLSNLVNLCGDKATLSLQEQVEDITRTWDRVHTRLSNRLSTLKSDDEGSKEEEMEMFIVKIGEIKAWLEKTEDALTSITNLPPKQKENTLTTLSAEVSDFKSQIDRTKQISQELIARGTLFQSRLDPEFASINRRWENISTLVKINEQNATGLQRPGVLQKFTEFTFDYSTLATSPRSASKLPEKDSLNAKKRFGQVYKSDEMSHLYEDSSNRKDPNAQYLLKNQRESFDSILSSGSSSAHFTQSEGSVDFGSELQRETGAWSGDFDDFLKNEFYKNRKTSSKSTIKSSENMRCSFGSYSSYDPAKDDAFFEMLNEETTSRIKTPSKSNIRNNSSSSGDDSDGGNTSQSRISAATIYEKEVLLDLKDSDREESNRIQSSDLEAAFQSTESLKTAIQSDRLSTKRSSIYDNVPQEEETENIVVKNDDKEVHSLNQALTATIPLESKSGKPLSPIPFILQLERHLSMDSSVSTSSEADTVIQLSGGSSPKRPSSVKKMSSFNEERKVIRLENTSSSEAIAETSKTKRKSEYSLKKEKDMTAISYERTAHSVSPKNRTGVEFYRMHKKRSRSSESSTEEQEISLDISDSTLSDSMGRNSDSKKIKASIKKTENQGSSENIGSREECFVIGNRYAMLHDKKKMKERSRRKLDFPKPSEKFEPNERMVESSIFGPKLREQDGSNFRFSASSFCTDISDGEPLTFSETEGEEIPYADTSDEDLNLEDQVLKAFTEKEESKAKSPTAEDNIEAYFARVSKMVDVISELKGKPFNPNYAHAVIAYQEFEQLVFQLEPDVATLISKGDTLTLKTHMVDVPKANSIRIAVKDLRKCWAELKDKTETLKKESEALNDISRVAPEQAKHLVLWLDDFSKKISMVNNDENQLKLLEQEIDVKRIEVENLNRSGELLKKYDCSQVDTMLKLINARWQEILKDFAQYQKGAPNAKGLGASTFTDDPAIVPDFLANVNRLRESISSLSRQMNSKTLNGKDYDNLLGKEEELRIVKSELERLKPKVDNVETERLATIKKATQLQQDQVRRVIDKLREEWAQVNRGYTDKHGWWLHNYENWRTLHKTIEDFSVWLNTVEDKLQLTADQPILEAKLTQKELEKQVTIKHRPSQTLQTLSKEVFEELNTDDKRRLQERVDSLLKRWRALLLELASRRERIAQDDASKNGTNADFQSVVTWVDTAHELIDKSVNVTDEVALSAHTMVVRNHLMELQTQREKLKKLKSVNFGGSNEVQFSTIEGCLNKVSETMPEYRDKLEMKLKVIQALLKDVEDLNSWTEINCRSLHWGGHPECSKNLLQEKNAAYDTIDNTYWALSQDAESKNLIVEKTLKSRMNTIENRLKALDSAFSTDDLLETFNNMQKTENAISPSSAVTTSSQMSSPPSDDNNVKESITTTVVTSSLASIKESVVVSDVRIPLLKNLNTSSPDLILAALDKSILQIRDWLTLLEQMSRQQTAIVGDPDDVRRLIEKQKSVLRELESKKPQLDDLVASADSLKNDGSRNQLHQQVSKLREHWDETNSVVLGRKTQLDAMLNDTHKFDSKRIELETWLGRMESRLDRMAPLAKMPDMLDQQMREQKSFHAEVHQYKHQFELFSQTTTRLVTIYQNDDTRRLKRSSDGLTQRYSTLNSNIMNRGKMLYGAMNSSHNFRKALEKFISWLQDSEHSADAIEGEVAKLPPSNTGNRRDSSSHRSPYIHFKDLQSEIENHKDVLASLNATGQKLLGTLENQDDAVLLHRRLDEMNHRWNTLKFKSIAIRNRLEGTAENWNSLLLSLRELIEWVIRKDTELSSMGPILGDVNLLSKLEEELIQFRRKVEEKQPVIESNLKSGRQLIASEPPLSDTSDSEAGRDGMEGDARYRGEDNTRELTRSVRREVTKLSEKWAALWERATSMGQMVSLANKKLGVLQKTIEDVGSRMNECEKVVTTWGPIPQDANLQDQSIHNVRKFRETLPDLQRGIDDVNDQVARFSAHNVPLTSTNSATLQDLNNRWKNMETTVNDRWRQLAGRSREVTPLTPAELASSVASPWERAVATNKVPYYINHAQETTHWDHPEMMDLLDSMSEFNHIKFSAYRTASKLRSLQKKLALDRAKLEMVTDIFDEHGLRGQNDRLIDVNDMVVVLSTLYSRIAQESLQVNKNLVTDLCLNWLLNVYDSQRTGQMRVLSFRIGLICLCRGHLEEKYRYMFRLIADPNRLVDQRKLGLLLHDCVQVPRQLGEVAAFGGSNIEPSVRSCFTKAGKDRETIEAVHFLTWVQQEPQSLVWLAVLHRVAASESVQHQVKCNICKTYPIVGLRYRCLKCLSFDMCQRCFFDGRSSKSHKITHPMHEYCTGTTAGDEMKDFTKALKNKFKSKRSLQKHTKKGYLPVQTVLEGDPLESPSPSPSHNVSSQDMHSSEDEHGLIAQYCQSLTSSDTPFPVPKSPLQIMASVDADQKDELEQMIKDLEDENQALQAEYERLKTQNTGNSALEETGNRSEAEMLAEAKLLREHKGRLEARMSILEDHNRQLEAQLNRLRTLLVEHQSGMGSPNKSSTLQTKSVTASQLAMDSPAKINGHSMQGDLEKAVGSLVASMNQETTNGLHNDSDENDYDNTAIQQEKSNGSTNQQANINGSSKQQDA